MKRSVFSVLAIIFSGIILFMRSAAAEDMFKITSIDVGKGDCILVQTGDKNVLIDTGYKDTAKDVIKYLTGELKVTQLDAVIITHFHKDHVGGAAKILESEKITVKNVYMPDYVSTKKVYTAMMDVLEKGGRKIEFDRLKQNRMLTLGDAVYMLYPSVLKFDGDNDNDVSMVVSLDYKGYDALFTGDLEDDGIKQFLENNNIPENKYDILKLPHHGSKGERTQNLIALMASNGIALITDGQDRRAHGTLIDTLKENDFKIYCSADDGTITITAADAGYDVVKSKNSNYSTDGDWKYLVAEDGSAVIMGYSGEKTAVSIPAKVGGHPVKSIGDSAFYNHKNLTSVTIPKGVESIGNSVFSWCTGLTDVSIPDSVKNIGKAAFSFCTSLRDVKIPDSVESIGESGFESCSLLKSVKLSNSLAEIAASLFERCENLESIVIPEGVQTIGEDAFKRCENLKDVSIPDTVTKIDEGVFKRCNSLTSVYIPVSVTSIKNGAFQNCKSLKEILYGGTEEQWSAVDLDENWNKKTTGLIIRYSSPRPEPDPEPQPEPEPRPERHTGFRFFTLPELPATGFSAKQPKTLSAQPKDLRYEPAGLTLQIPSLDVAAEIVTVPFRNGEYPVAWLGNYIGLPEEFALPGSEPSLLLGHSHLNTAEAGPFALLGSLTENTRIYITGKSDKLQTYSVFANEKIAADDMAAAERLSAACGNSLLLITCEDEKPEGGYASRRVIAAKPLIPGEN